MIPRWHALPPLLLALLATTASALETKIDQKDTNRQVCSGMYSRKSWGGSVSPFILTKFLVPKDLPADADPVVSLVVFEWADKGLIGYPLTPEHDEDVYIPEERVYICDDNAVQAGYCNATALGTFILSANATATSHSQIITQAIHLKDPPPINYPIKRTGYYCVGTYAFLPQLDAEYTAVVEFRNAFGELPAAQIAKLPFYAALTLTYAFLALGWAALYYLHRSDILAVQNYITAILAFLVVEMFMTWQFYDYQNRHGLSAGAKALMVVVAILSAARNSFSFFLLLIVCMGYGVVKPSLGKTMLYVRILAGTHFAFGVLYAIASLAITPEHAAGLLVLLVVLPLAATLTAFYIWTLSALNATMKDLLARRQTVKAGMYRKLWWCILASIMVIFAFFFVNSWTFAGSAAEDFVPRHWQTRWFVLDGWLNLVYGADVAFVSYVWRPSANNRRFAMSQEIAQDDTDDGFEIASLNDDADSLDIDLEDPEAGKRAHPAHLPPGYDAPDYSSQNAQRDRDRDLRRDASPLPAPIPTKPSPLQRKSLEADTMFALEDEEGRDSGEWGSERRSGEEGEGERLTGAGGRRLS
ncbi:Membrane protein ptm1 [Teratosphaeriaceae sp. CCFEE 6253]|nr:Membrane protein ptm1 [Teratosphaeriaceae sp. CCFEE 6253]